MGILVQFLNREKHVICFTPSAYTASSWLWRGQVFLQGRMNHVSAWSEGWQDHSCSNGGSQSHRRIRYLFLKTGMNEKQKTLSHHDQGKKEKVNSGKEDGPFQRSSSAAGCPMAEATLPKLLQQKFLKPFPKNLPWHQCQHLVTQTARRLLLVSHLRTHCIISPPEAAGISRWELRTQPFEYKIEQNLKYQYIIHSMQQAWKGSGKDEAFMVFTERT